MFSYHNHSVFSDGSAALEQMIISGVNHSLTEVGMSDHFSPLPDGRFPEWSMDKEALDAYFTQLTELRELYADKIIVRRGVEIDYFDDNFQDVLALLGKYSPDYIIGSVHYFGDFPIDECADKWVALSREEADAVTEGYWRKVVALAGAEGVGIMGHLDLCKKFGRFGKTDVSGLIDEALCAIRDTGKAMEINTAGYYKPAREFYPAPDIIRKAAEMEIPLLVNADAHYTAHIRRSFPDALRLLSELGVSRLAGFEEGRLILRDVDY